jgi:starch synthase
MKILYVTSEAVPYYKTGGLADVSRALPDALTAAGHDVRILLPLYGSMRAALELADAGEPALLPWPGGPVPVRYIMHHTGEGAPAVLVDQPVFFDAGTPYEAAAHDPLDAGRRFAFFSRAAVLYARAWRPDVVHANDWTTGFVPVYGLLDGMEAPTLFAIHNLAYQGNFPPALLDQVGVPAELYRTENGVEFMRAVSFMKAGLALSDRLITVSPTYAQEIQTTVYGSGFDGLLRFRRRVLTGILNGIDTVTWNPARDPHLAADYTAGTIAAKETNRNAVLVECGLSGDGPLFTMVGRLVHQKGMDLVIRALPALLDAGARLAVLGSGDRGFERELQHAARTIPDRIAFISRFDEALAHRLYAGADFFLMPSRYEPCGLGQMIAQRYGTPPVVRHTGGLVDTVTDGKTGFIFDDATPDAVAGAVRRAATLWRGRGWNTLRRRCMRLDHSWARSAELYLDVYRALATQPGT